MSGWPVVGGGGVPELTVKLASASAGEAAAGMVAASPTVPALLPAVSAAAWAIGRNAAAPAAAPRVKVIRRRFIRRSPYTCDLLNDPALLAGFPRYPELNPV
jgi:hypothetical protein